MKRSDLKIGIYFFAFLTKLHKIHMYIEQIINAKGQVLVSWKMEEGKRDGYFFTTSFQ
jgi:hypothetical protein